MCHEPIQEHCLFKECEHWEERYDKISSGAHPLIEWKYNLHGLGISGYYSSYNIGAQWVNEKRDEAIVVAPKMENVDFVRMFMTCFGSDIAVDEFNKIYEISVDETPIKTSAFDSVLSPLIVIHFLSVVGRIKSLKKGYIHRSENLKKVRGHINILKNERKNIMMKRFDRVFCEYDEYSVDIPENRLIKKALLFAKQMVFNIEEKSSDMGKLRVLMTKDLAMFEQVSAEVEIRDVKQIRGHKLYAEYKEAIRLAKLILRHYDYNVSKVNENKAEVVPFVIDMPLLYEHYVFGLLCEAYGEKHIEYQFSSDTTGDRPDILFLSEEFPAILDTKYKPQYENIKYGDDSYGEYRNDIRQLSGYGRNVEILEELGYDVSKEPVPHCVIIYPKGSPDAFENTFKGKSLRSLCVEDPDYLKFHKICVPLPMSK